MKGNSAELEQAGVTVSVSGKIEQELIQLRKLTRAGFVAAATSSCIPFVVLGATSEEVKSAMVAYAGSFGSAVSANTFIQKKFSEIVLVVEAGGTITIITEAGPNVVIIMHTILTNERNKRMVIEAARKIKTILEE